MAPAAPAPCCCLHPLSLHPPHNAGAEEAPQQGLTAAAAAEEEEEQEQDQENGDGGGAGDAAAGHQGICLHEGLRVTHTRKKTQSFS